MADAYPLGSEQRPLRVAVIGSGPAGFYTADDLLKKTDLRIEVDLFDRMPMPFGLVRFGVAPDHQKIKSVIKQFEKTAKQERFRFLGNVTVGRDLTHDELMQHYDHVVYCVGAETDRRMKIPGEDLEGSHPATQFVGWYNGHPDYRNNRYDLTARRVVVVGVGDVALDIARVMLRSCDDLGKTDIAGYALQELRRSEVREVICLGRRGPAQAAFAPKELKDIDAIDGIDVVVDPKQIEEAVAELDSLDPIYRRKVELMQKLAERGEGTSEKKLRLQFLASPVELVGDDSGHVVAMKVERNELVKGDDGWVSPQGTGDVSTIETRCVFRSVGYHGVALDGVPFDPKKGVIPNDEGRVTAGPGGAVLPGVYACGWIKRGPSGVIGTNKSDAVATVKKMIEDVEGRSAEPSPQKTIEGIDGLLRDKGVRVITYPDWEIIDRLEIAAGQPLGKLREKYADVEAMLRALDAEKSPS